MSRGQANIKVGIVILNFRNPEMTIKCVESLLGQDIPCWEAVVVDNDSGDGSALRIREALPWVTLLESGQNLGYAGGNRVGLDYFQNKRITHLWILNNDTQVDPACLRNMLTAFDDEQVGAVGCQVRDAVIHDQVLAYGGGRISLWLGTSWHVKHPMDSGRIHFLTGASLLVPMSVIKSQGFLDEGYFLYYEDAEYSLRLRKAGYKLKVAHGAIVYHSESGTIGRRSKLQCYYINRSIVRFLSRNALIPIIPIVLGTSLRILRRVLFGPWDELPGLFLGLRHGWTGRNQHLGISGNRNMGERL